MRVDDDVWEWLKSQARPLEDTPNTVLRRVAGIDPPLATPRRAASCISRPLGALPAASRPAKRVTGEWLNRAFNLEARHSLYHKDGMLYERLIGFPGVLCDPKGFVRYEDEEQFMGDPQLNVGEKVNIPRSLSAHPRYSRFPALAKE